MEKMAVSQRTTPPKSNKKNSLLLQSEGNNEVPKGSPPRTEALLSEPWPMLEKARAHVSPL